MENIDTKESKSISSNSPNSNSAMLSNTDLESEVAILREENQRLQEESQTAAQQLRRFTEWFFQTVQHDDQQAPGPTSKSNAPQEQEPHELK